MNFVLSLLLHTLLLTLGFVAAPKQSTPVTPPTVEVQLTGSQSSSSLQDPGDGIGCPDGEWFGGVGLEHDLFTNRIPKAPSGYPAYRAGVRVGDILLNEYELRGDPGTEVQIQVDRADQILVFKAVRTKICVKGD